MPFSQATISDVRVDTDGPELFVSWASSAPWGTCHQVYVDGTLAWSGRSRRCHASRTAGVSGRNIWVDVGTVNPGEETLDFSAMLPVAGGRSTRASLAWKGGTYLDPTGNDDIRGFLIYGSDAPGGSVDYTKLLDTVPTYPGGWISDGFGMDGFGGGGFGRAATPYQWESGPLSSGVWRFAVAPYDAAGNASGAGRIVSVTIAEAPRPPAASATGERLAFQYSGPDARLVTLTWLASPSAG